MENRISSIKFISVILLFFAVATTSSAADDIANSLGDVRIVGGQNATEGEHPWTIYLSSLSTGQNFFCGGSLIASDWVITAAHCVFNDDADDVNYVVAGVYARNTATSANAFVVQDTFIHPGYSNFSDFNDIALLKLANPVPLSLVDTYANLPSLSIDSANAGTDDPVKVLGWGATSEDGSSSNVLQEVTVPVTSEASCQLAYTDIDYDIQICAGLPNGGRDSCQGDSGGPLLFTTDGEDYLAGLVSFGAGCARPNFPGVYTRVSGYLDWIASHIDENPSGGNAIEALDNGESRSLAASEGEELLFSIDVPAGARFDAAISGGSGDADLYTRFEAQPTTSSYDCRPYRNGNSESCSDTNGAGTYFIMVRGYRDFSGVTLSVNHAGGGNRSQTISNLSAIRGNWTTTYTVDIPRGTANLNVEIRGSNGDADVYVYQDGAPTTAVSNVVNSSIRCVPLLNGSNESCNFSNPAAGTWYVRIHAYSTFTDLTLRTNYE